MDFAGVKTVTDLRGEQRGEAGCFVEAAAGPR